MRHKLDVLARACSNVGRDRADIEITLSTRVADGETARRLVDRAAALADLGVDHLIFVTNGPWQTGGELDVVLDTVEPLASIAA